MSSGPRTVEERIQWFLEPPYPERRGLCANWCWRAARIPYTSSPDAAAAFKKAKDAGFIHTDNDPPRGAMVWWTGGSHHHGHVAISLGDQRIATTDAYTTGTKTGEKPLGWPAQVWHLHYEGWSHSYAHIPLPKD
jgi:hypothetical protein